MSALKVLNVARFEVETDAVGLVNLIRNPNGELGGWAWLTPLASSVMAGDATTQKLTYTRSTSGASNFTSELMPITAGQFAGASIVQQSGSNAYHRLSFEWYTSAKALISTSTQTALTAPAVGATTFLGPIVAPATTAYMKLRVDLYTSGGANPTGANTFVFNNATVAAAATSGAIATVRTNLIKNPTFETNASFWSSTGGSVSLARSTVQHATGAAALSITTTAAGQTPGVLAANDVGLTQPIPVTAGLPYSYQARLRAGTTGRNCYAQFAFVDAGGSLLGTVTGTTVTDNNTGFTTARVSGTAPIGAVGVYPYVLFTAAWANGEVHYLDSAQLEQAAATGGYFDGTFSASGTKTYAWTGTANASTSTETDTQLFYFPPVNYVNILGSAYQLEIDRDVLSASVLTGKISDVELDPAVSTQIRPGRRCRFTASSDGGTTWTQLFAGKLLDGSAAYIKDKNPGGLLTVDITVQAVDAAGPLSAQGESRGVGTIAELPYILEGKGVPWNCNGSGQQVASATQVSSNENASVLDQLTITRDSVRGYAWVDRLGIVQAWDAASISTTTAATFSDTSGLSYSDIDVDWSLDTCINSVTVKWLRYNPATGETTEITYGPYIDQTSIDTWGAHSAEYTIHGGTESAATIAAYAAAILAANGTPAVRCNSLKMPVRTNSEIGYAATLDLYSKVHVNFTGKINADYRITSIKHTIEANAEGDKWMVFYEFDATTSVAQPITTPSPPNDTLNDGIWQTPALGNSWVATGGSDQPMRYMRKNGIVYVSGIIKNGTLNTVAFTLPAGFRPTGTIQLSQVANGAFARASVASNGQVIPIAGSNVWFCLHFDFPADL